MFTEFISNLYSIQIVDGQYRGALILVTYKAEAFLFAGDFVAHQIYVHNLTVLGEHTDHIALAEIVRQTADEYPGTVLVLVVPRWFVSVLQLQFAEFQHIFHIPVRMRQVKDGKWTRMAIIGKLINFVAYVRGFMVQPASFAFNSHGYVVATICLQMFEVMCAWVRHVAVRFNDVNYQPAKYWLRHFSEKHWIFSTIEPWIVGRIWSEYGVRPIRMMDVKTSRASMSSNGVRIETKKNSIFIESTKEFKTFVAANQKVMIKIKNGQI